MTRYTLLCSLLFFTLLNGNATTITNYFSPQTIEHIRHYSCPSCALQKGEFKIIGGVIASSEYFEAQQDYAVPIPGFIIIASKRHVESIDEFTTEERNDFIEFVYTIRKNMREKLECKIVYMIQEEGTHFHLWLFPRYDWMEQFGKKIRSVTPIMKWAQEHLNTEENVKKVEEAANTLKIEHLI